MTEIANISSKDVVLSEIVKEVVQVQNLEITEEHICRVISKEVKGDEFNEEEISGFSECEDQEKKLLLEKGSLHEKEEVACFEEENKLKVSEGIASKRRFVAEAIFSVVGISRNVEEGFELFTEEEKDLIFQEELSKPDDENKMLKNFPNVDENEPNYLEEIDIGEPIQFKSHEDFQEAVKDFPELLKWSKESDDRRCEILNILCAIMGGTLEVLESAENRLNELETMKEKDENLLSFEQLKNKYSSPRSVLEDQKKSEEFQSEIGIISEITAVQIGQFKELFDKCERDREKTKETSDRIDDIKLILERTKSNLECLKIECVGKHEEAMSEIEKEKESSREKIDQLKGKHLDNKIKFLEQYRKLNEMYMVFKETQTLLAVSEAKHVKLEITSVKTNEEMKRRICVIDDQLDDLRNAHAITEDCARALYETIHINGENKLERNINQIERTYRMKEEEGKRDVQYLIDILKSFETYNIGNVTRAEREGDRISEDEYFQNDRLSSYNGFEDYDDIEKDLYRRIQSEKSRNTRDLQRYKKIEEYMESVLKFIMRNLSNWTDVEQLLKPLVEERYDRMAVGIAHRIVQILIKLNDNSSKLYNSIFNNNIHDDAAKFEKKLEYYLLQIDNIGNSLELSAINRPNINSNLQELRNQVKIFLENTYCYFNDERFKMNYPVHCSNVPLETMNNLHKLVVDHLSSIELD